MAATPRFVVRKHFTYKGSTKHFNNAYHVTGGVPSGTTPFNTVADAIVAAEKVIYPSDVVIDQVNFYPAGSDVASFTKSYAVAGTLTLGSSAQTPGNTVFLVRYTTTQRTSKNHPIYLFNYYHGARFTGGAPDAPYSSQKTAATAYAGTWCGAGFSDGTNTYLRAGPNGAVAQSGACEDYLTHRDFRN